MISVIVCSIKPQFLEQLKLNIKKTIGVAYELLAYDNREGRRGICEVYNELAKCVRYEIICFAHEDILFETHGWGKILLNTISNNNIGAVGVAGSKYKSAFLSGWYTGNKKFDCANISHKFSNRVEKIYLASVEEAKTEEVVCHDGVFICCKKELWQLVLFDEVNLKGFHFYDIDFSLRAAKIFNVAVTYEIDIIHVTEGGDFGNDWIETAINYHQFRRSLLPFTKLVETSMEKELSIAKTSLDVLKKQKISWKNKRHWIQRQKLYNYPSLYYSIVKFLFYTPFRLDFVHKLFK